MNDDEVRSPASGDRRPASDDEIDLALASLTDASPSAALKTNVMRHIRDGRSAARSRRASGLRSGVRATWDPALTGLRSSWRVALAGAAIVLVALAMWPMMRSGAPARTGGRAVAHDITLPEPAGRAASRGDNRPEAEIATRAARRPRRLSAQPVGAEPGDDAANVMAPLELRPIPELVPVTMAPLPMNPIEIREIELRPLDEPPDAAGGPSRDEPARTQPGGGPGAIR